MHGFHFKPRTVTYLGADGRTYFDTKYDFCLQLGYGDGPYELKTAEQHEREQLDRLATQLADVIRFAMERSDDD